MIEKKIKAFKCTPLGFDSCLVFETSSGKARYNTKTQLDDIGYGIFEFKDIKVIRSPDHDHLYDLFIDGKRDRESINEFLIRSCLMPLWLDRE